MTRASAGAGVVCRQHEVEGPSDAPSSEPPHRETVGSQVRCLFPQNHINPAMDFTQTPPGMLALDNMLYLAKVHQDTYIRVKAGASCPPQTPRRLPPLSLPHPSPPPQIVLENSSREDKHECPFGRSAIELTKMLCEILQVGELRKCAAPLRAHSLCSGAR